MELVVEQDQGRTTLHIRGPVRLGEVPDLLAQVTALSSQDTAIALDLSQAEHLHCAAWQVLVAWERELKAQGHDLALGAVSEATREIMTQLLGLQDWLSHGEDVD